MAGGELVYATLLLSDSYLPGALVLAHSLRDARTTKKLAVLVTLDTVSADAITQLKTVYDHVLPVPRIRNANPSNLYLMNRADLHSAFTKINLWKLVQFERIVYLDADALAYRAPEELFDLDHVFAASPDIGWPDIFNTGVMVISPNMGDYYAMMAMAERGISFDGADQGLLNMHFKNAWHRLSFAYNVTPSAHYQYVPAYRHFQSTINVVHFIGRNKPWFAGREAPNGGAPYDEMVGRWWAVYDGHYRASDNGAPEPPTSGTSFVQYFTKGEFQPPSTRAHSSQQGHGDELSRQHGSALQQEAGADGGMHGLGFSRPATGAGAFSAPESHAVHHHHEQPHTGATESKFEPPPITMASWDAQRHPPPADSKPEALNFPSMQYTMSSDPAPFVPPERYPSPPKNMYYEVPQERPAPPTQEPKPLFPWETHRPRASRTFPMERPAAPTIEPPSNAQSENQTGAREGTLTDLFSASGSGSAPETPSTPVVRVHPPVSESWGTFQLSNAWDEIPQIGRYVEGLQKHRHVKSMPTAGDTASALDVSSPSEVPPRKSRGFRLTDFPSETERPSLPVTPAPIARPSFWGSDDTAGANDKPSTSGTGNPGASATENLPSAEGVPVQAEWDPEAQLKKLAKKQHEHLLRRLGTDDDPSSALSASSATGDKSIPKRNLPFGSEDVQSPTYLARVAALEETRRAEAAAREASGKTKATRAPTPGPGVAASDDAPGQLLESALPRTAD